jgi:hypothetical protein
MIPVVSTVIWDLSAVPAISTKELKMPEYADWAGQDNLPANITVAYESMKK